MIGFSHKARLAQRLLCSCSLMLACAATSGCLWPTSLTDAVTDNTAVRPVFSAATPAFGILPSTPGLSMELQLSAEDPNGDGDLLHVRLFKQEKTDTVRVNTSQDFDLNRQGGNTSNVFSGHSRRLDLCGNWGDETELFVVVSDAPFLNDPGKEGQSNGLTSENYWILRCQ